MAAASVSSLGPPTIGPGNSAATVGFTVSAQKSLSATRLNSEPLSGNTLCHKNNVERKRAIHENRLASIKASLSLSTPRRMDFMDKRLSKNFHQRRHHEKLVYDNLKLLRALEEIHSRNGTAVPGGDDRSPAAAGGAAWSSSRCGGKQGSGGGASITVGAKRSKGLVSGSTTFSGGPSRKKLNSLLARKRKVKAALVARENEKMIERMAKSESLYSRDKMRQHRARHQRVLRLRKTDYTAGHLLAAATAKRHWSGGDSRDEGFSYSFEEGRQRHRQRNLQTQGSRDRGSGGGRDSATSVSPPTSNLRNAHCSAAAGRGASYSPTRGGPSSRSVHNGGGGEIHGRGTKSAPRLPSLYDVDDIYGGGGMLGSPSLEQCREAMDASVRSGGRGAGGGGGSGSHASSSRNSNDDGSLRPRSSTEGGNCNRRGPRLHRKSSGPRCGKDAVRSGGVSSTRGVRGTDGSVDSLSHRLGSFAGSSEDGFGGARGGGRFKGQRSKGGTGSRGENSLGASAGADKLGEVDDLDRIFNPLAFLDEMKGVRVLIQATKPLEVLNHAGETWICFIRIMVKDPFDDQLDIRVIHDREEVCRRVLSLKEANAICQHAQATAGAAPHDRFSVFTPAPCASPAPPPSSSGVASSLPPSPGGTAPLSVTSKTESGLSASAGVTATDSATGGEDTPGSVEDDLHSTRVSGGLNRHSKDDGSLNDFLTTLFKRADTEQKGFLTPEQLTSIMQHADLGLTGPELHLVIAEADDNADGTIDYYEFIPLAYNLVNAFRARRRACEEMDEANFELDQQAIHALYDAEFDRLVRQLKSLCKSHDPDGTGVLPRAEFKQCVSGDRCGGLTNIESKLLLNLLPKDPNGGVIYQKLGAGLEQVRFTTLRNTVAEASATDTHKYLMALCREEDAKSDHLGNKGHIKSNGDAIAIGGKHYSGVLRARQLSKLLLNAPLLSLSRLHVTALMSQAHIVDGMVNYVELVPVISKTIERMFNPQSLKMRHEIFKNRGNAGGSAGGGTGGGGTGGGAGDGSSQQQGSGAATVLGKSRDDIQRIFVDVLREDKQGAGIERLKDPATFERCIASLGLDLEPDTISALWVAADLDSRPGTTFVDVVDFCFNCVLFMEREKEVKTLQRTRNTATRASQNGLSGRATPGAAAVARAEAVAAAALAGRETPAGKADPLLSLARTLVRRAKVTAPSEGKVGLEFQLDKRDRDSVEGSLDIQSKDAIPLNDGQSAGRRRSRVDGSAKAVGGARAVSSSSADTDEKGVNNIVSEGGARGSEGDGLGGTGGGGGGTAETVAAAGLRLRSEGPEATVLLRARRRVPVVGSSGQPIMLLSSTLPSSPTTSSPAAVVTATGSSDGTAHAPGTTAGQRNDGKVSRQVGDLATGLETAEAARGETRDMFVCVYWDGAARDRAHVEAYPAETGGEGGGGEGAGPSLLLSLGVRVPTLAIVDSHAASKFAERVVRQIAVQVDDEKRARGEKKTSDQQQGRHQAGKLRLAGVDAKSVVVGN